MMPTTRAASTPSRSAIRKAESTESPLVNHLQLHFKCIAPKLFRQPDQLGPISQCCNRLSCRLPMRTLCQGLSLLLAILLNGAQLPAQAPQTSRLEPSTVRPDSKRAQKAAERGEKAEAAGRFDEALAAYGEAARYAPQDMSIIGRGVALRSRLVRGYVEAAERDALAGHLDQATEELAAALQIDPGNGIVAERLTQFKTMEDESPARRTKEISGLPRLQPQSGKRNLNLRGDTKTVYQQTAELFGVKAAFDPDLTVRSVSLRVDDVDFYTAVSLLGVQTGTFWRPLNPTLMFVAQDTPEKLALAGKLIQQVEKARGEVMLEIELLEVDRNTAQKLGIETPSKARLFSIPPNLISQLNQANNLSTLQTLLAGIFGGAANAGTSSLSSLIPPLIAFGGGKSTFLLTLPGAAADFSNALSLVQSGRQVLMRAQDGKPATFFVGDRFPITLSLLSGSLGTAASTPNVGGVSNPFPSTSYPAGVGPVSLVAADFLNNGLLDLAAVNQLDNSVTILLNQSGNQGTFVQATGSPISLGPARTAAPAVPPAIASAVLTSSGFHDLLITDPTTSTVNVLLSNGDGTFKQPAISIPVGKEPSAVVTGSFNSNADANQ